MMTYILRRISAMTGAAAVVLVLAATPALLRADTELEKLLPANAVAAFVIQDAPGLITAWEQSPFSKLMNDDEVKRYLAPSLERENGPAWDEAAKKATGHTLRENLETFKGPVLVAMMGPAQDEGAAFFEKRPSLLLVGHIGDDPAAFKAYAEKDLKNTEEQSKADYEERTEDYLGETLNLRRKTSAEGEAEEAEGWAIVGSTAVIAYPQDLLRETVSALKNPSGDVALPADFKAHQARAGDSDVTFFVNLSLLEPAWRDWASKNMKEMLEKNPAGVTLDALIKGLAPENISSIAASIDFAPDKTHLDFSVGKKGEGGILSLLTYSNGELRQPAFVPANTMHAGVARFDFAAVYDRLFEIAKIISPMIGGMIEGQLTGIETQIGVNLRQSLLGSLGNDLVFFEDFRTDGPKEDSFANVQTEVFYAVSLKNAPAVESTLSAIRSFLGQGMAAFEEREVLGVKVYTFKLPTQQAPAPADDKDEDGESGGEASPPAMDVLPVEISHAIAGGYLFVSLGSQRPMERALSGLHTPSPSLWDKPAVRETLEAAGQSAAAFEYYDYSGLISKLLKGMNQAQETQQDGERMINPDASPDAATFARYIGMAQSLTRVEPNALYTRTTLGSAQE